MLYKVQIFLFRFEKKKLESLCNEQFLRQVRVTRKPDEGLTSDSFATFEKRKRERNSSFEQAEINCAADMIDGISDDSLLGKWY